MQIEISSDNNIDGGEKLNAHVTTVVEEALSRFSKRITRVEVHLHDANSDKGGGGDKRCVMEARLEGRPPMAVTSEGPSMEKAVAGAATKLKHLVESTLGRESSLGGQRDHR